jgi:xanthine dehydrogenase molybdopterin-binding subunit B
MRVTWPKSKSTSRRRRENPALSRLHDHGVQVNPMIVDGQTRGGIAHGIGNALYEWMVYDDSGQPITTTFTDISCRLRSMCPRSTAPIAARPHR